METVKEVIENIKTTMYVVTKDGKILAINNIKDKELLYANVKKVEIIPGVIADVTAIRL